MTLLKNFSLSEKLSQIFLLISLLQGLCLLLLHEMVEREFGFYGHPQLLLPAFTLAIVLPIVALLSLEENSPKRLFVYYLILALMVLVIGSYTGYQLLPYNIVETGSAYFAFTVSVFVGSFYALLHVQTVGSCKALTYERFFIYSWRNALTLALASLFSGIFYGILMLWAGLFKLLNISFFMDLFSERWFVYPALTMAFGIAIKVLRTQDHTVLTVAKIQQSLLRYLLPILIFIAIIFLLGMVVQGPQLIWETGRGSTLILWLIALNFFFLNAVYQPAVDSRPYSEILHKFISMGLIVFPIYSSIVCYGLFVRIEQYGLTVSRLWGLLIWLFLAMFTLFYAWNVITRRWNWPSLLGSVNLRMGYFILVMLFLTNTPIFDFRQMTLNHQFNRLATGEVTPEDFDYRYVYRELAGPGYKALVSLRDQMEDDKPKVAKQIQTVLNRNNEEAQKDHAAELIDDIKVYPMGTRVPESLVKKLFESKGNWIFANATELALLKTDLSQNYQDEFLLIAFEKDDAHYRIFFKDAEEWQMKSAHSADNADVKQLKQALSDMSVKTVAPEWKDALIGETQIQISR